MGKAGKGGGAAGFGGGFTAAGAIGGGARGFAAGAAATGAVWAGSGTTTGFGACGPISSLAPMTTATKAKPVMRAMFPFMAAAMLHEAAELKNRSQVTIASAESAELIRLRPLCLAS